MFNTNGYKVLIDGNVVDPKRGNKIFIIKEKNSKKPICAAIKLDKPFSVISPNGKISQEGKEKDYLLNVGGDLIVCDKNNFWKWFEGA